MIELNGYETIDPRSEAMGIFVAVREAPSVWPPYFHVLVPILGLVSL